MHSFCFAATGGLLVVGHRPMVKGMPQTPRTLQSFASSRGPISMQNPHSRQRQRKATDGLPPDGGVPRQRPRSRSFADAERSVLKTEARAQGWLCTARRNIFHDVGAKIQSTYCFTTAATAQAQMSKRLPHFHVKAAHKYGEQMLHESKAAARTSDARETPHLGEQTATLFLFKLTSWKMLQLVWKRHSGFVCLHRVKRCPSLCTVT